MSKNLAAIAELDHNCSGFDGCKICERALLARSREKWNRLQRKWDLVMLHSSRHHIDPTVASAIFSETDEEKQERQEAVCRQ